MLPDSFIDRNFGSLTPRTLSSRTLIVVTETLV